MGGGAFLDKLSGRHGRVGSWVSWVGARIAWVGAWVAWIGARWIGASVVTTDEVIAAVAACLVVGGDFWRGLCTMGRRCRISNGFRAGGRLCFHVDIFEIGFVWQVFCLCVAFVVFENNLKNVRRIHYILYVDAENFA